MRAYIERWRSWFNAQPWSYRWILIIVLVRPFIDLLWFTKRYGILSPLQITGALTILLSIIYALRIKIGQQKLLPFSFLIFALLLLLNQMLVLIEGTSVQGVGFFLRTIMPVILFVYLTRVVNTYDRFRGFLDTFLVASIFPIGMLLYESVISPISYVPLAESRGGGYRLTGFYADLFSYMSYVIGDLLIFGYLGVKAIVHHRRRVGYISIVAVLGIGVIALFGLKHQASWGVFIFLISNFLFYIKGKKKGAPYVVLIMLFMLVSSPFIFNTQLRALFSKEISVYENKVATESALNGRIRRWERYFKTWSKTPNVTKLFGVGLSNLSHRDKVIMSSGGMHSDYVRFLFGTGVVGLSSLLIFYAVVFFKSMSLRKAERFFVVSAGVIMLMYGITSNPFGSSGSLLILVMAGFSMALAKKTEISRKKSA